tara:strand:+ start:3849 stop:4148 length:300 start_codon:yes stop_codon:yes gene_type:complete
MNLLPKVIQKIILKNKETMELHTKYFKCIDQIRSIDYFVQEDSSSRMMSVNISTNYFLENNGSDIWIHNFKGRYETVTSIHHNNLETQITFEDYIIHSF